MKSLCFLLLISSFVFSCFADDPDLDLVKKVLNAPRRDWSKSPWQEHVEDLKPLGDRTIPLLATLISDAKLGDDAAETMLAIDFDKSGPIIFAAMPNCDRNVQCHTFSFFNNRLKWGAKISCSGAMHDAAVRCIEAGAPADVVKQAVISIVLTGNDTDFPLLERIYNKNKDSADVVASGLARMGHPKYLKEIEEELSAPVPNPLPINRASILDTMIRRASYSRNARFIGLVAKHLYDPMTDAPRPTPPPPGVHLIDNMDNNPYPSLDAIEAMDQLTNLAIPNAQCPGKDFANWKEWWEVNRSQFLKAAGLE